MLAGYQRFDCTVATTLNNTVITIQQYNDVCRRSTNASTPGMSKQLPSNHDGHAAQPNALNLDLAVPPSPQHCETFQTEPATLLQ